MQLDQGEVDAYNILYITLYILYWISAPAPRKRHLDCQQIADLFSTWSASRNSWNSKRSARRRMSAESAVSGGLSPARQEFISCCSYYFLVIFKQATILVFWQDKHVDILLNIFFIPSGSTFTVSPTTTAGMLISLFNFNSNFALKIDHFYFRVVGIDSRGEDKDSTNCVICLTGDNLSQAKMEMDNLLLFPISHICLETTQSPLVISWWLPRKLPNVCLQSHIHWLADDEDDWQIFNNKDDGNN